MKIKELARKARELQTASTPQALWHLGNTNAYQVKLFTQMPAYNVFTILKKNGSPRIIEDPYDELQRIQANLNIHLQALYYFYRTDAAYGYIIKPDNASHETRNIVTAAKKHSSNSYLLNIDIKDFFHYVHRQDVVQSLTASPFKIDEEVANGICDICIYNERLPMGAPTSPALSNIAVHAMDTEIQNYCNGEGLTYTRYVDDMSFSSNTAITDRHFSQLSAMVTGRGYPLKEEKIKWFGPADVKVITGLCVKDGNVYVAEAYIAEIFAEIKHLQSFVLMQTRLRQDVEASIRKPVQKIKGALAFVEAVHGSDYEQLDELYNKLEQAIDPPQDYESLNWLDIGYTF